MIRNRFSLTLNIPFKIKIDKAISINEAKFVPNIVSKALRYPPLSPALATKIMTGPGVAIIITTLIT